MSIPSFCLIFEHVLELSPSETRVGATPQPTRRREAGAAGPLPVLSRLQTAAVTALLCSASPAEPEVLGWRPLAMGPLAQRNL